MKQNWELVMEASDLDTKVDNFTKLVNLALDLLVVKFLNQVQLLLRAKCLRNYLS